MCSMYWLDEEEDMLEIYRILERLNGRVLIPKAWEVRPTDSAPVLAASRDGRTVPRMMRWGFPKWDGKGVLINARQETAAEKPLFRDALRMRRAAVPTCGFFEWMHLGGKTTEKYRFRRRGDAILYLAAIYGPILAEGGAEERRFCVLTTQPNETVAAYHNRMPVLLRRDEIAPWIHDGQATQALISRKQDPLEAEPMEDRQATLF